MTITSYQKVRNAIERAICSGKNNFIIYPYGEYGIMVKQILNDSFGIMEKWIIDNKLSQYNDRIKSMDYCRNINCNEYTVLFTCANPDIYVEVRNRLDVYFYPENVMEIFGNVREGGARNDKSKCRTLCGKYSYGPLCDHWLVKSVGAFCSFAPGTNVVENHPVGYISTHPYLFYGGDLDTVHQRRWEDVQGERGYFEGIRPKGNNYKLKKIEIGSDVWLGRNVLITNSANIGNGVIAGAGAVITKDVPDYAVVVGVPARIIRYRYTEEEIAALKRIAWWDWTDEKIRKNYDDFYLDIKEFIRKYDFYSS